MPTWRDRRVTLLRELTRAAGAAYVDAQETRTPRCRCVRVKGRKEARADNCLGGVKEGASEFI